MPRRAATPAYYIHGTTPEEQGRLSRLNTILNDGCFRELDIQAGHRILDVGCGLGQFTRRMARACGTAGYTLGIERDPSQLEKAQRLAGEAGEADIVEFRQGDATRLPLRKAEWGSFDIAHARFILEHVPHPEQVVQQMRKALKPGGLLILSDDDHDNFRLAPEPAGFHILWDAYTRSYDRAGNDPRIGRRLVSLLHQAGMDGIRNTLVFFGGNAHQPIFPVVAENVIGLLEGARSYILKERLLDPGTFDEGLASLRRWKGLPDAALWYGLCWAEGRKPLET